MKSIRHFHENHPVATFLIVLASVLILAFLFAFSFAQSPDIVYNFPAWGSSVFTFALAIALFVQAVKVRAKRQLKNVPAWVIQVATLILGNVVSLIIYSQGMLIDPMFALIPAPWSWLVYGSVASLLAIGGYDLIMAVSSVLGRKGETPALSVTPEDAESLLSKVKDSSLPLEIRKAAVTLLKQINPAAGLLAESLLNELATRAPTPEETRTKVVEMTSDRDASPAPGGAAREAKP